MYPSLTQNFHYKYLVIYLEIIYVFHLFTLFFEIIIIHQYIDFVTHKWVTTYNLKNTSLDEKHTDPASEKLYTSWVSHMYTIHRHLTVGKSLRGQFVQLSAL